MADDPHQRARDEDRERTIERLHQAFVDGQLTATDHQVRFDAAMRAATLGDIERLTRDLRDAPAATVAPATSRTPARRPKRLIAVSAVAAGLVVVAGTVVLTAEDEPSTFSGSQRAATEHRRYEFSALHVNAFVRAYERRFGTSDSLGDNVLSALRAVRCAAARLDVAL